MRVYRVRIHDPETGQSAAIWFADAVAADKLRERFERGDLQKMGFSDEPKMEDFGVEQGAFDVPTDDAEFVAWLNNVCDR